MYFSPSDVQLGKRTRLILQKTSAERGRKTSTADLTSSSLLQDLGWDSALSDPLLTLLFELEFADSEAAYNHQPLLIAAHFQDVSSRTGQGNEC